MVIICKYCNKEYSSQSSRSNHIKKFHLSENLKTPPLTPVHPPEKHQITPKNTCNLCNITFSRKDSLTRHINKNRCKNEVNKIDDFDIIKKENIEIKKEMLDQRKEMEFLKNQLQKALKIHPKTLQKINNQLNNSGTI